MLLTVSYLLLVLVGAEHRLLGLHDASLSGIKADALKSVGVLYLAVLLTEVDALNQIVPILQIGSVIDRLDVLKPLELSLLVYNRGSVACETVIFGLSN